MKVKKGLSKRSGDCPSGQSVADLYAGYPAGTLPDRNSKETELQIKRTLQMRM